MGVSWSAPDALWGLSFLSRLSIPWVDILVYGLGLIGWLTPESSRSCNVIWARAFKNEGDSGLNADWNC